MRRRAYLAGIGTALTALAGCLGTDRPADGEVAGPGGPPSERARVGDSGTVTVDDGTSGTRAPGPSEGVPHLDEVDLPLEGSALTYATGKDTIPAITDPAFGRDWAGVTIPDYAGEAAKPRLEPTDEVIGVVRQGSARAYPLLVLSEHEVVNDTFYGPLLVTYCPLCGAGVTAIRRVGGEATVFGVSGKLWKSDLVMYDDLTGSYWSQILATAVRGPATGASLDLVPSTLTTWGAWRATHPETRVLRPPPESETITGRTLGSYVGDPYAAYEESRLIGVTGERATDTRLHPKARVLGIPDGDGVAKAYPMDTVRAAGGVVNDAVGSRPVVVATGPGDALVGYDRLVGGSVLRFAAGNERYLTAGGSRWGRLTGDAVDGPHEGTTLRAANARPPMYWFAWLGFHPETTIFEA
ncbi:MAG: DUF3179 domain-containing protein [Haloarculaceae archaeon]